MKKMSRKDFLDILTSMTDTELNDYIKAKGKPPKKVVMCRIVDKEKEAKTA